MKTTPRRSGDGCGCQTLLISGMESAGDPAEDERTRSFPQAHMVGVADAGHWVHHDQLDIFLEHVERFLAE